MKLFVYDRHRESWREAYYAGQMFLPSGDCVQHVQDVDLVMGKQVGFIQIIVVVRMLLGFLVVLCLTPCSASHPQLCNRWMIAHAEDCGPPQGTRKAALKK